MSEWRESKIGSLIKMNPETMNAKSDFLYINYLDTGSIIKDKIESITRIDLANEKPPSRAKRIVREDDIVYSTVRPANEHYGIIKSSIDNLIVSTGFAVLRADNKKISSEFLYYFLTLKDTIDYLSNIAEDSTSAYPAITPEVIENLDILYPEIQEQRAIAEVLSSLDDKIDLLNRQNKTLEALAQTYFRQWFIEEADEDWEKLKLGNCVKVIDNRGKTPPYITSPTAFPIIEVKSISNGTRFIDYTACEKFVLENVYNTWFRAGHPQKNDILISTVGSIGEIVFFLEEKGSIAQNVVALRAINISHNYLYQFLRYYSATIKEMDIGSVQPSIKVPHLLSLNIVIPPKEKMFVFDEISVIITDKMRSNVQQIQTLQKLRDTLLPKLISGEVRVTI